jgi:hypothetical protein
VVASYPDVVHAAVDAQGDGSGLVDAVGADAVVGVEPRCRVGFESGVVDDRWGGAVWQRAVGPAVVVFVGEGIELGLQFGDGGGAGLAGEPFFECLMEAFNFPAGGGVVGGGVDLLYAQAVQFGFEAVAAAFAAGESGGKTMPLSVSVEYGMPWV